MSGTKILNGCYRLAKVFKSKIGFVIFANWILNQILYCKIHSLEATEYFIYLWMLLEKNAFVFTESANDSDQRSICRCL